MTAIENNFARWLQIRGDPAVREFIYEKERVASDFDKNIDQVLARIAVLVLGYGVFHAKVHFSTGQVTLWLLDDPLRYRIHVQEEFFDPDFLQAYRMRPYTPEAIIPSAAVPKVLGEFKRMRLQDHHIYLRSGSVNVVNGMVGLNFSCDGSHYLGFADFLARTGEFCG